VLVEVLAGARQRGELPLLHIECHGNDDELSFADNSRMTWGELYPLLRDINVATGMRLLVSIAACFGAYLGKHLDLTDRAAFVALLSPPTSICPDTLRGGAEILDTGISGLCPGHNRRIGVHEEAETQPFSEV